MYQLLVVLCARNACLFTLGMHRLVNNAKIIEQRLRNGVIFLFLKNMAPVRLPTQNACKKVEFYYLRAPCTVLIVLHDSYMTVPQNKLLSLSQYNYCQYRKMKQEKKKHGDIIPVSSDVSVITICRPIKTVTQYNNNNYYYY